MLSGGVVIVRACVGEYKDSLNFIFDTGSGGISLDSTTVVELGLPVKPTERMIRGIGGIRKLSYVMDETLRLPRLQVSRLDFHINDYELLTSVYGVRIDGIIGYSLLSRYIVKVNYDKMQIEVWTQGTVRYPKGGHLLRPTINTLPVMPAWIRDASNRGGLFYMDTGAGLCMLLTEDYVRDSTLLPAGKKITITQGEGLGGKKIMRLTTLKEIKIGHYRFRNVPAHLFEDEFRLTNYPELGGLVGNDLLRRFNLVINYQRKEIHLSPNSHFSEQFDYSYTGLGIYLVDGEVLVEDVIPGSPGEKAGLKIGDVILAVNNNFSGNIQTYKTMMQVPHARLKVIVRRGEDLNEVYLRVASIR